jgi:methionyl-tRNA formyltransferase
VRAGDPPRVPQDERVATYDPLLGDVHAGVDWSRGARAIHDLVRGCDPNPGAHTAWRGARLRLFEPVRTVGDAGGATPGTVRAIGPDGLVVAAGDGVVRVKRLRGDGPKAAAAEVAATLGLAPGARLG